MSTVGHWVGGKHLDGAGDRCGQIRDPSTGQVTGDVAFADRGTVDAAVSAASEAFAEWRHTSLSARTRILFKFRELAHQHADDLARRITAEHGKVLADARGEVSRGLEVVEFACGIPHLLKGGFSENVSTGVDSHSMAQPLGVAVGITPFNFPVMVPMWMHPIAIACGNAFVLKPSEKDPSASLLTAELWAEAGLPDGVFNVVNGDREAVERLLTHEDVAAVSFVGSTPVARSVYETATAAGKRVQALGGAKNHMVVLPDAAVDLAAESAINAAYGSAGERCMAISVAVAVGDAGDALAEAISARLPELRVGPGTDPDADMGPLITREHRDRVAGYLEAGQAEGATLLVDGREHPVHGDDAGFWLGPCLFDHVTPDMSVYQDEIFGPVLVIVRAADLDEALALVNENPYGNGAAVFTRDGAAARRFQHEAEIGMVGINTPIPVPMAYYSFGGWKNSLFGDTHVHGTEGVHFYTRTKAVTTRWPAAMAGDLALAFPQGDASGTGR